ncbi:hypothetical protein Ancab_017120 [Ancistrocladus abbreviatus]
MASETEKRIEIFFFPFLGGGHMIPMIDTARVFASHGVKSTIITLPSDAHVFHYSINHDHQQLGRDIHLHILPPPSTQPLPVDSADMSAPPFTDTSMFRHPFEVLLKEHSPDCIVVDNFHRWAAEVVTEPAIPRLIFNGSGCFPRCIQDSLQRYSPRENIDSEDEPFTIPGLPDRIELTKSQLPPFDKLKNNELAERRKKMEVGSIGFLINSFYELESAYVEYYKKHVSKRAWLIGPVSLCNRNVEDKANRGQKAAIDENLCLNWLSSKKPNSVLYISFGSLARLPFSQFQEIAYALEASESFFIWAIGKILKSNSKEEGELLPEGFEERMTSTGKGLIIRGWAPQLLILENPAIGGFLTHCGWNSMMEGVCAGVPMITWPLMAEQFSNEKLVTEVLRIGVQVGSKEWGHFCKEDRGVLGREKIREAVLRVMAGGDEAAEMRRRYAEQAERAVEKDGSSHADADGLIEALRRCRKE